MKTKVGDGKCKKRPIVTFSKKKQNSNKTKLLKRVKSCKN